MYMPDCEKCENKHGGKGLAGMGVCFGCGKNVHQLRNFPTLLTKGKEGKQALPNGSKSNSTKLNHFYALPS